MLRVGTGWPSPTSSFLTRAALEFAANVDTAKKTLIRVISVCGRVILTLLKSSALNTETAAFGVEKFSQNRVFRLLVKYVLSKDLL